LNNLHSITRFAKYKKSDFLRSVDCAAGFKVLFHAFFGRGMYLENRWAETLDSFSSPRTLSDGAFIPWELLREFIGRGFVVRADESEREIIENHYLAYTPTAPSGLCLNMAAICNFRCFHCIHYAGSNLDARSLRPARMPFETARLAIDWVADGLRETGQLQMVINFGGGEPLINWPVIAKVLEHSRRHVQPFLNVRFSLNTNASLMTPQIIRTLKEQDVIIIASLDGLRTGNDIVRRTRSGRGTFDLVQHGFNRLDEGGLPVKALHVNLNSKNFDYLDHTFVDFLDRKKIRSITLEPDLTDRLAQPVSALVEKVMSLKKAAREKRITVTGYWERPFARIIQPETDPTAYFCRSISGKTVDVMPDGSLYCCSYTNLKLGDLKSFAQKGSASQLLHNSRFKAVLDSRRIGRIERCRGCELEGVCGGGCYATAAYALKRKDDGIVDYRCDFYRDITKKLLADAMEQSMPRRGKGAKGGSVKNRAGVM